MQSTERVDSLGAHGIGPPAHHAAEAHHAEVQVTDEMVKHIREQVKEHLLCESDDVTIRRFIRATGGNLPLTLKRLEATCAWRIKERPQDVCCKACNKKAGSHYMHVVGHDLLQRPIIYSCLALATDRVYADNRDHMLQTFEMAVKCMPEGVEQWVWLCDFHGFGLVDAMNPKIAKAFLDISGQHYPERLGLFWVLDAPPLFSLLWKAIEAFIDPKTYQKIRFLPYDAASPNSKFLKEMRARLDGPTAEWIIREAAENRDKKIAKTKAYDIAQVLRDVTSGKPGGPGAPDPGPEPGPAGTPLAGTAAAGAAGAPHDVRGTAALLEFYRSKPSALEPQASFKPS